MRRFALPSLLILAFFQGTLRAAEAPAKDGPLSASGAIALAEKFVAKQGYTDLQPKAVGARFDSDIWFVGFRSATGNSIRGITVRDNGKSLKRVSQNLQLEWLTAKPEELKELNQAEATALAEKLAAGLKKAGLPKKAAKTTANKPNPAGDPWNAWWVWFQKPAKPGSKTPSYSIVSVNKETHETKWVKSDGKPGAP